jgi:PHAX RNA-binding domain
MGEQATEPQAQSTIQRGRALAQQLGERTRYVHFQLERCLTVLGEAAVDELLAETEQIEQGEGLLTQDGKRRRTKGGVFLYLARQRCTPDQRAIVFPVTGWRAQKAKRKAKANRTTPTAPAPAAPAAPAAPVKATYFFPGVAALKTTLKGRPIQSTVMDGYTRLLFERTEANDSFPAGVPAAPSEPQRVMVYVGAKQWAKVKDELQKPTINLTIDGVMILENGKLVLRAQGVAVYEKPPKL